MKINIGVMQYSNQWLIEKCETEERVKFLFFWGHQPSKDGRVTQSCFSQWWIAPFEKDGIVYPSAEHWMMAGKARLFNDNDVLATILAAKTPAETKKLGRMIRHFDAAARDAHKFALVEEGNYLKFSQHSDLKDFLLGTAGRVLAEASPVDNIWGIGMAADDADIENPLKWKGENLLGYALMEVRDKLS